MTAESILGLADHLKRKSSSTSEMHIAAKLDLLILKHQTGWRRLTIQQFIMLLDKQRVTERRKPKKPKKFEKK